MKRWLRILLLIPILLAACRATVNEPTAEVDESIETQTAISSPTPTATETPPKVLTICTTQLPENLFPYGNEGSVSKENLLAMTFESGFVLNDGEIAPGIVAKVPTRADGDLRLAPVSVQRGQLVMNAEGSLAVLKAGVRVFPSGCRQPDCALTWDGESSLEMDQMMVTFQINDGLSWSDGTAVIAADSVLGFEVAEWAAQQSWGWAEERTMSYRAVDTNTIEWVGVPGFTTSQLDDFFWTPLPSYWFDEGQSPQAIVEDERWIMEPPSYGPFMLASRGIDELRLEANQNYYLAEQGLPKLDAVIYKVVAGGAQAAWEALQSGGCDVLDSSFNLAGEKALLAEISQDDRFAIQTHKGLDWIQLAFGITPSSYDDGYQPAFGDRPDFFGDPLTRQALTACLDRRAMLDEAVGQFGEVWNSFLPPDTSLLEPADVIGHDPVYGVQLLEQVGWLDHDGDAQTPRQAFNVAGINNGEPLSMELLVSQAGLHSDLAEIITRSLGECGVAVTVTSMPASALYAPGPQGPVFGRQFDLALIAWQPTPALDCLLYQTEQVPSGANNWIGTNIAGLSDAAYDSACLAAAFALPEEYDRALRQAEELYVGRMPAVPLFAVPEVVVLAKDICSSKAITDPSNIFEGIEFLDLSEVCP